MLDPVVFRLLQAVLVVNILSEMAFTLYVDVYGFSNVAGHLLKVVSFWLLYMALVRESVDRPLGTLFRELADKEAALVAASEREKKKLGRELHDGLCQELKGIEMNMQMLVGLLEEQPPLKEEAVRVRNALNQAVIRAYDLSRGLWPIGLAEGNLVDALRSLAEQTHMPGNVQIEAAIEPGLLPGNEDTAQHLYRIAREALHNARYHAQATRIELRWFQAASGSPCLTIKDDGQGFCENGHTCGGMGLEIMRYRAQQINATLTIKPAPEGGTEVTCLCP